MTLGFSSPNTFGTVFFSVVLDILILLKDKKQKILWYLMLMVISIIFFKVTDSRTSIYLSIIVIVGSLLLNWLKVVKIPSLVVIGSYIGVNIINILPPLLYKPTNFFVNLNNLFSGRIAMSKYFIDTIGVHWFGSSVSERLNNDLFYGHFIKSELWILDNGYFRILINQGLIFFLLFLVILYIKLYNNRNNPLLFLLFVSIFIFGIFERYAFNPLVFSLLLCDDMNEVTFKRRKNET
ncbi:hypothetical protein BAU17_13850 [Enterococcus sp. CU12B]|uniref:Polysaccharide polymerase n=2 Tax=Candidatus Enterococcus willemsii TaxID=1857215 RepID=A0ABQ6Z211_9ENTE|nr:hypothetical protein BAU17_13850 [Enterococcus sp. CU12B]